MKHREVGLIACGKYQLYFISLSLVIHSANVRSKVLNTIKSRGPTTGRPATPQQVELNTYQIGTGPNHTKLGQIHTKLVLGQTITTSSVSTKPADYQI